MVLLGEQSQVGYGGGGSDELGAVLVAECADAHAIRDLLKTLSFREHALVTANKKGIRVSVDDCQCLQGAVYLNVNLFERYHVDDTGVNPFTIPLGPFCECLNLFSSGSGMGIGCSVGGNAVANSTTTSSIKLVYMGHGHPLQVITVENEVVTDCKIKTIEPEACLEFDFEPDKVLSKVIIKADGLRETFSDFDSATESVEITVVKSDDDFSPDQNPKELLLRFTAKSEFGEVCTDFTEDCECVERFVLNNDAGHSNKYRLNLIKKTAKALQIASKVSIRTHNIGTISLQYMVEQAGGQSAFIEFFCMPDTDDYEMNE